MRFVNNMEFTHFLFLLFCFSSSGVSFAQNNDNFRFEKYDTPTIFAGGDQFGTALAAWGNYAIGSSTQYTISGNSQAGAVVVYERNEISLEMEQNQTIVSPNPIALGRFGQEIDLCRKHMIVTESGTNLVYVYEQNTNEQWVLFDTLTLANVNSVACAGDYFALSTTDTVTFYRSDGNSLVGDGSVTANVSSIGFGDSISMDLFADVDPYIIVGATGMDDGAVVDKGAAYVYKRTGSSTWVLEDELRGSQTAANDLFGHLVRIKDNVATVVRNTDGGFLYVFERDADNLGGWTEIQRRGSLGGNCLAMNARYIAVGDTSGTPRLRTYLNDGSYALNANYPITDYPEMDTNGDFGETCAMSDNGHLLAGDRTATTSEGSNSGAVVFFREAPAALGGFREVVDGQIICDPEWEYKANSGANSIFPDSDGCLDRFDAATQPFQHDTPAVSELDATNAIDSTQFTIDTNRWCSFKQRRCGHSGQVYRPDGVGTGSTCTDGETRRSWGYCIQRKPIVVTEAPTSSPTKSPTLGPTTSPSKSPTTSPTTSPTLGPTLSPTMGPTLFPTRSPTTSAPTFENQCSCPRRS